MNVDLCHKMTDSCVYFPACKKMIHDFSNLLAAVFNNVYIIVCISFNYFLFIRVNDATNCLHLLGDRLKIKYVTFFFACSGQT